MRRRALLPLITLTCGLLGCAVPFEDAPTHQDELLEPLERAEPQAGAPGEEDRKPLRLETCLQIALRSHRAVRVADRRVLIAEDRLSEAWSVVFPRLTARGSFEARSNDEGANLNGVEAIFGERERGSVNVHLIVPVYTFGRALYRLDAAEQSIVAAQQGAERTRQEITLAVSAAYFRLLEAQRILGVVEDSILVVERQLEIARDHYAQGLVARNDVLAAEVQLARRSQERIRARGNVELARATLNRLCGLEIERPTEVVDVLETSPWAGSFGTCLRAALDSRPDLVALRSQIEASRALYRATRADYFPMFGLVGDFTWTSDDTLLNQEWFSGGVGFEWPLFGGGETTAQLRRREKEIAEAIDLHDERVDDIALDVKKAFLDLRNAAEQIPVARKGIELAEENLRIVNDQYGEGLLTSADVLTEEERLTQARSGYYRALYGYHLAFAYLANAVGERPPEAP